MSHIISLSLSLSFSHTLSLPHSLAHTLLSAVCAIFSVVGFIFSCCLATTVAAQSGALAGLGVAFISKPILFEVHEYRSYFVL